MRKNSKSGWILYVMLHVPFLIFCKIGITGVSILGRAKQVDRAMIGFPLPIFFVILPGAYHLEQWLHRAMSGLQVRFYRGDGASEWFWLPAGAVAILFGLAVWVLYALIVYLIIQKL
jgi:hypothetical protein